MDDPWAERSLSTMPRAHPATLVTVRPLFYSSYTDIYLLGTKNPAIITILAKTHISYFYNGWKISRLVKIEDHGELYIYRARIRPLLEN